MIEGDGSTPGRQGQDGGGILSGQSLAGVDGGDGDGSLVRPHLDARLAHYSSSSSGSSSPPIGEIIRGKMTAGSVSATRRPVGLPSWRTTSANGRIASSMV